MTALQAYGIDLGDTSVLRVETATTGQNRRADVSLPRVRVLPPDADGLVEHGPRPGRRVRRSDLATIRVNRDRLRRPRQLVLEVHARLVARGYRGPAPTFGPAWVQLFERV